ncbi:MAG: hypothetical protein QNK37_27160 [Acidobacteriota bacterium]|nr:hypothetical protein [Acidobacteriota bacterium]
MRALLLLVLCALPVLSQDDKPEPRLWAEDGQLVNHYFRVFVENATITKANQPLLSLEVSRLGGEKEHLDAGDPGQGANWKSYTGWEKPLDIYPNYSYVVERNENPATLQGTLLIFDLKQPKIIRWFQPTVHINPEISWIVYTDDAKTTFDDYHLTAPAIYLGNRFAALIWSLIPIVFTLAVVIWFSVRLGKGPLGLLRNDKGLFSLSRTQISIWTFVIGSMVATYGLIQLKIPDIPNTLVVMMGLSLFTSTAQSVKENTAKSKEAASTDASAPPKEAPKSRGFADMIYDDKTNSISLPKAQMLFWTVLNIGLFLYKSIVDGELWAIPEEMVVLMGASQSGYLLKDLGVSSGGNVPAKTDASATGTT